MQYIHICKWKLSGIYICRVLAFHLILIHLEFWHEDLGGYLLFETGSHSVALACQQLIT